jgi:hypothetical protein
MMQEILKMIFVRKEKKIGVLTFGRKKRLSNSDAW